MRVRLRGPSGTSTLSLDAASTAGDLRAQIKAKTSLESFDIKYGYPPKPLELGSDATLLSALDVKLDGEQLTVGARDDDSSGTVRGTLSTRAAVIDSTIRTPEPPKMNDPIGLSRKAFEGDVPEIPMPDRGATLLMRVMPDDNSCLFRAFGTAVLPGDDLSMPELRALVASTIQEQPEVFSKVVLEQNPDEYCRWIQTEDAWGGAIELGILANHFGIEICSMDVQSLRIDRFNEGQATRCILVYSGIHYDTIVQSPSDPPHTRADSPPDFDRRVWDSDDDDILLQAQELGRKLQAKHYFTDTGGMAIKCKECGWLGNGQARASAHAMESGHYDMTEVPM